VIGGRLMMFAVVGDSHSARRAAAQDAIAPRGRISSTAMARCSPPTSRRPACSASAARIIDKDEAIELLTATLPDLDTSEVRDRFVVEKGFVWLKREITPLQQREIHRLGVPGIGFLRENKRVTPPEPKSRI